eukprot:scaffold42376_cov70-Cyclotella_meneghiniana.AAC.2
MGDSHVGNYRSSFKIKIVSSSCRSRLLSTSLDIIVSLAKLPIIAHQQNRVVAAVLFSSGIAMVSASTAEVV